MKQLLAILCICTLSICSAAQEKPGKTAIDQASLRCYYAFSKKKPTELKPYRVDTMVLDIGSEFSRFYDPARLGRDSLIAAKMKNTDASIIKSISIFKGESSKDLSGMVGTVSSNSAEGESVQVFKSKKSNQLKVLDYVGMGQRFLYVDSLDKMSWKILPDTATIATYPCQKATLSFRGRDYIAWFTTEVPVNDGPWKFSGLPGLIVKIEDTKALFSFQLVGLQQLSNPQLIQLDEKSSLKCTRAEFEKQKLKQGAGMQVNFNAGDMIIAEIPGQVDYTPIEIE